MANEFKVRKGLIIEGASGGTVFDVQGSQGQLFSVTDDLSGTLFKVSDISGISIFEVDASGESTFYDNLNVRGNILLTGEPTTANQGRMIDFTGFDKENTTDFSDRAYIQHTENTGGHSGSVLVISSQNDSSDGIAFSTHSSSMLKHNGNNILTAATTFGGDVSGTYNAIVVANDSHTHDGRYYTETESDGRFIRKDADDSFSGNLSSAESKWIKFYHSSETDSNDGKIGAGVFDSGLNIVGAQTTAGTGRQVRVWGSLITDAGNSYWHAGNDGSGSGLDADTLDGQEAADFALTGHNHDSDYVNVTGDTMTGNLTFSGADNRAIVFLSNASAGTEQGFIRYISNSAFTGTGDEEGRLTIGVSNDFEVNDAHFDAMDLQGGTKLTFNIGDWDSELDTIIGAPNTSTTEGQLKGYEFRVHNSPVLNILDNGNVGIGTTTPNEVLHVSRASSGTGLLLENAVGGIGSYVTLDFNTYNVDQANFANYGASIRVIDDGAYSGDITFRTKGNAINAAQSEKMRIDGATGNVGIGTTDPSAKLDVAGRAVIGTGNTLTNATNATVIGNSNNLTNDSIVDSNTNLVLGDYGAGRYGNTVISDRTLRLGRADNIGATSLNTTGILNFNDSVLGNSAFSNVGGFVGYFPPPTATNNYNFITALSENVSDSVFQPGASPTAYRMAVSMDPNLDCVGYKFDSNTSGGGGVYYTASQNNANPSSRGIFTFDARHQNQNSAVPDGHSLFEVTSGYGQTKFLIKQVSGSSNVGIGTTNPGYKLDVSGTGRFTSYLSFNNQGYIRGDFSGELRLQGGTTATTFYNSSNSSELMRITQAGNVGIGESNVVRKLHVRGGNNNDPVVRIVRGNNTAQYLDIRGYQIQGRGNHLLLTADDTKEIWLGQDSNTQRMVINSAGNVGIGDTNPDAKLTVFRTDSTYAINLSNTEARAGLSVKSSSTFDSKLTISSGASSRQYIQAMNNAATTGRDIVINPYGGNVGVGATSPSNKLDVNGVIEADKLILPTAGTSGAGTVTTPAGKLDVRSDSTWSNSAIVIPSTTNQNPVLAFYRPSGSAATAYPWHLEAQGSNFHIKTGVTANIGSETVSTKVTINSSGNVGIGQTNPSTYKLDVTGTIRATGDVIAYSDIRVKENIKTIDNALDKVKSLRGVEYNKIDNPEKSIGVIAQEIEEVIPEVVKEDDQGMKSVAYGNITAVLIEAIKEQQQQIDELKKQLDAFTK